MTDSESPADFYDSIADFYELNYGDWQSSIGRQAAALDSILRDHGIAPPARVLDAACGIGTQSLGLAALGYRVAGSDISPAAVSRAREEAANRRLPVDLSVADMRTVGQNHQGLFDAVIACDNSLPHLLTDGEILRALRAFCETLAPGGICLISVRDYASEVRQGIQVKPPVVHSSGEDRRILFQVWQFDNSVYDMSLYLVEDSSGAGPAVQVVRTRLYAITTDSLLVLMGEAGFVDTERLDGAFFQPVLVGRKPGPEVAG